MCYNGVGKLSLPLRQSQIPFLVEWDFFVAEIRLERRKACSRRAELAQNEAVHYL